MASVHEYKRLENNLVKKAKKVGVFTGKVFVNALKGVGSFFTRRYTVVFVPHSEKKLYNLQVSILSVICFFFVFLGVLGSFFWYGVSYTNTRYNLAYTDNRLRAMEASLSQLRDEAAALLREARGFEAALSDTLYAMGTNIRIDGQGNSNAGDLSSFFNLRETPEGVMQEADDLRRFSAYLARATAPIRDISTVLNNQDVLLTEIPSIWPIQGGAGRITMGFGRNVNPFTGLLYIHRGIDISTHRSGDPVVATANGQVVTIDFCPGFGNFIVLRHLHGYYTRYAHLHSFRVRIGQHVRQGEVIGLIGNTGLSTGPHLHYEVHIGSDVVNPYRYINIRPRSFRPRL